MRKNSLQLRNLRLMRNIALRLAVTLQKPQAMLFNIHENKTTEITHHIKTSS